VPAAPGVVLGEVRGAVDERRPLVDEARVDLAHELAEPLDDVHSSSVRASAEPVWRIAR
jgi:hypothetical protein